MAEDIKKNAGNTTGLAKDFKRRDEYSVTPLPATKWQSIKYAYAGGLSRVIFISLLCVLFCLPAIAWVVVFNMLFISRIGGSVPYGAHDGLGFLSPTSLHEGLNTAIIVGNIEYYTYNIILFAILVPLIAIAAMGIGGIANVARNSMFGEKVKIVSTFFKGVGRSAAYAITGGILLAANFLLIVFCFYAFDAAAYGAAVNLGAKIASMIGSIVLMVIMTIFFFYMISLSLNYKVKYFATIKDAFILTFKKLPSNLLACVFAALVTGIAVLLSVLLGSSFALVVWIVYAFFGLYFVVALFTAYNQKTFDKEILSDLAEAEVKLTNEEAYAAIRAKKQAEKAEKAQRAMSGETEEHQPKKNEPKRYVNPKKRKKGSNQSNSNNGGNKERATSVNSVESVNKKNENKPAAGGYTAAEIKQMQAEREKIKAESSEAKVNLEDASVYEDDGE